LRCDIVVLGCLVSKSPRRCRSGFPYPRAGFGRVHIRGINVCIPSIVIVSAASSHHLAFTPEDEREAPVPRSSSIGDMRKPDNVVDFMVSIRI
jgi:hypothetical protein